VFNFFFSLNALILVTHYKQGQVLIIRKGKKERNSPKPQFNDPGQSNQPIFSQIQFNPYIKVYHEQFAKHDDDGLNQKIFFGVTNHILITTPT
jgi:hypothetical protein